MLKMCLYLLNAVYLVLGVILLSEGVLYCLYIYMFTSIRNSDHYLLDHNPHWPQIFPWIHCFIGIFVIVVSVSGCCSVNKSRLFTVIQVFLTSVTIATSTTAAVLALVCTDTEETAKFLKEALYDAFSELTINPSVLESFGKIEVMLHCCAVENPTEYKKFLDCFPKSCCGLEDCDYSSKAANERYGCAPVAAAYSSIALKVMAVSAVLTAFFGVALLSMLLLSMRKKQHIQIPNQNNIR